MKIENVGLDLAVFGSIISVIGVIYNNLFLQHETAMFIWCLSNILLMVFFWGQYKHWWNDGISSEVICGMYGFMLVSGLWGLLNV